MKLIPLFLLCASLPSCAQTIQTLFPRGDTIQNTVYLDKHNSTEVRIVFTTPQNISLVLRDRKDD